MCLCPWRPEEGAIYPRPGITGCWELSYRVWALNPGPLEEPKHWAIFPAPRPRFLQWITLLHKIICGQSIGREWEHLINLIPDLFMVVWVEGHLMLWGVTDDDPSKVSSHAGLSMRQDPNESHCSKRPQRSCGQGPPCSHSCSGEMGITTLCPKDSAPWHLPYVHRIYAYMGYHCIDTGVIYVICDICDICDSIWIHI